MFGESSTVYEEHMQHNIENSELTYIDPLLLLLYSVYGNREGDSEWK